MKVVVPVLVLAAAAAAATLEIASILEQAGPILLKATCALPCLDLAANKLPCSGGPVDTVCAGLGTIQALAAPCLAKCGIDAKTQDKVFKHTKNRCDKRADNLRIPDRLDSGLV